MPFLFGELDQIVQTYLRVLSKRRGVANTTVKALMSKYPNIVGKTDIDPSGWAKSFLSEFCKTKKNLVKSRYPRTDLQRIIGFIFLRYLVSNIPEALIININQTPIKYVPVDNETLGAQDEHSATTEDGADKRYVTKHSQYHV